jgi:Protein of unknown function (DUF2442)
MLVDVVAARALEPYYLWIRFDDGAEGTIDVAALVSFRGVFEPLGDPAEFARAYVDPELGTVAWPCGADLDPLVLHSHVTGSEISLAGLSREHA